MLNAENDSQARDCLFFGTPSLSQHTASFIQNALLQNIHNLKSRCLSFNEQDYTAKVFSWIGLPRWQKVGSSFPNIKGQATPQYVMNLIFISSVELKGINSISLIGRKRIFLIEISPSKSLANVIEGDLLRNDIHCVLKHISKARII